MRAVVAARLILCTCGVRATHTAEQVSFRDRRRRRRPIEQGICEDDERGVQSKWMRTLNVNRIVFARRPSGDSTTSNGIGGGRSVGRSVEENRFHAVQEFLVLIVQF